MKAGDLLFTIDPAPYQAAVSQAEGQVASAEAKVSLAQIELERGRRLSDSRTISQSDMDQRQSAFTEAQAGLRTAQAALQLGSARSRLHRGPGSGFWPSGQAGDHRRQPCCCGFGFPGAHDARFDRSDLCELQRQRRDGDEGAVAASGQMTVQSAPSNRSRSRSARLLMKARRSRASSSSSTIRSMLQAVRSASAPCSTIRAAS